MSDLELVADCACVLGDGPLWHPQERRLYWLDIGRGRLLRFSSARAGYETCYEGVHVGGMTVQVDGSLLLFMEHGAVWRWRETLLGAVVEAIPEEQGSRFNDVIATPSGRVLAGTLPTPAGRRGSLYLLDTGGAVARLREGYGCPNGMGFAPDRRQLYLTDSETRTIERFDFDEATGRLGEPRVFVHLGEGSTPDGLTVDLDGFVWSALQGSGRIVRFAPDGTEDRAVELPTPLVTSVAFGGDAYRDLYVTTGGADRRDLQGTVAGAVFRLRDAGQGAPEFFSRVLL
jgi:sugar lactone lactonase YvrE